MRQRLLVSIRGRKEALAAVKGGAHIADVEFPASALGTPYPLNIRAVKNAMPKNIKVATNISEEQSGRSNACQSALGVALAGADIVCDVVILAHGEDAIRENTIELVIKESLSQRGIDAKIET